MGKDATFVAPLYDWTSAIADSDLTPTQRHVALTFALHLNKRTRSAYPGASLLARETGLHLVTVKRALLDLEQLGWLVCRERGGAKKGGKRMATVWVATIPTGSRGHRVSETTGSPVFTDRESCARGPVAQDYPNYQENHLDNSAGAREDDFTVSLRESAPSQLRALRDTLRNVNEEVA